MKKIFLNLILPANRTLIIRQGRAFRVRLIRRNVEFPIGYLEIPGWTLYQVSERNIPKLFLIIIIGLKLVLEYI